MEQLPQESPRLSQNERNKEKKKLSLIDKVGGVIGVTAVAVTIAGTAGGLVEVEWSSRYKSNAEYTDRGEQFMEWLGEQFDSSDDTGINDVPPFYFEEDISAATPIVNDPDHDPSVNE